MIVTEYCHCLTASYFIKTEKESLIHHENNILFVLYTILMDDCHDILVICSLCESFTSSSKQGRLSNIMGPWAKQCTGTPRITTHRSIILNIIFLMAFVTKLVLEDKKTLHKNRICNKIGVGR